MISAETISRLNDYARAGSFEAISPVRIAHFSVPRDLQMNDVLTLSWDVTNAESTRLVLTGSIVAEMSSLPARGTWSVVANLPGPVYIELSARGEADGQGNHTTDAQTCEVSIRSRPVRLVACSRELRGRPGTLVRLQWCAEHAARVRVRRPMFDETIDAHPRAALDIRVDEIEDLVEVMAISHDGESTETFVCRVRPVLDEIPSLYHDLAWFNEPLSEEEQWHEEKK